jgi:hypothetical protein
MQKSQSTKSFIKLRPAGDCKHRISSGQKSTSMGKNRMLDFRQNVSEDEKVDQNNPAKENNLFVREKIDQ